MTFAEFLFHGKQINVEGVGFLLKNGRNNGQTAIIIGSSHPMVFRKKVEKPIIKNF